MDKTTLLWVLGAAQTILMAVLTAMGASLVAVRSNVQVLSDRVNTEEIILDKSLPVETRTNASLFKGAVLLRYGLGVNENLAQGGKK